MSSAGIGSRLGAAASANALRVVGLLAIVLSVGIAAATVSTTYGLRTAGPSGGTAACATDVGAVGALVAFAVAHPAYPVLALCGFVLVVLGADAPLLGS
ncbi:MAG: hypothetical protein ABEJ26_00890 [Halosimplex sp.]